MKEKRTKTTNEISLERNTLILRHKADLTMMKMKTFLETMDLINRMRKTSLKNMTRNDGIWRLEIDPRISQKRIYFLLRNMNDEHKKKQRESST